MFILQQYLIYEKICVTKQNGGLITTMHGMDRSTIFLLPLFNKSDVYVETHTDKFAIKIGCRLLLISASSWQLYILNYTLFCLFFYL